MTTYYILSGEGESGTWEKAETTEQGLKNRLTKERCGGDRWAKAYSDAYELADGGYAATDIDSGETRSIPAEVAERKTV